MVKKDEIKYHVHKNQVRCELHFCLKCTKGLNVH